MTEASTRPQPAAVVDGLGTFAPPRVVSNDDFAATLDTSDEWIRTRTGIVNRHIADPDTATSDLAVEAGARAMKSAGSEAADAVVLATTSPDQICPSTAPKVAARLGLGTAPALDVNAVCSGFVYGLATAAGLIAAGVAGRVLMVAADAISHFADPEDRATVVLFGDGAGAVTLRAGHADEPGAVGPFDLGSDGMQDELITVPAGGSRRPASQETVDAREHYISMDGREVYRQAIPTMLSSSSRVLAQAGRDIADVDRLVAHQANARILEMVAERLGLPRERCTVNIDRYGNTAGASIPLALADAELTTGDLVLMTAFGGGLTWGSALMTWPDLRAA